MLNVWQVNINGTRRSALKCSSHLSLVPELCVFYVIVFSVDTNELAISSRMRIVVRQTPPFQCLSACLSRLGVHVRSVREVGAKQRTEQRLSLWQPTQTLSEFVLLKIKMMMSKKVEENTSA